MTESRHMIAYALIAIFLLAILFFGVKFHRKRKAQRRRLRGLGKHP